MWQDSFLHAGKIHAHHNILATVCTHAGGQEDDRLAELIRSQMYLVKREFLRARQHYEKGFEEQVLTTPAATLQSAFLYKVVLSTAII